MEKGIRKNTSGDVESAGWSEGREGGLGRRELLGATESMLCLRLAVVERLEVKYGIPVLSTLSF